MAVLRMWLAHASFCHDKPDQLSSIDLAFALGEYELQFRAPQKVHILQALSRNGHP